MKRVAVCLLLAGLCSSAANAAPLLFDYVAHVDSSDRPGAPVGTLLTGRFGYDPEQIRYQIGTTHYPQRLSAPMTARGSAGFSLSLEATVIDVIPDVLTTGGAIDNVFVQSFQSESPNDWHMVIEFREPIGPVPWLDGSDALPGEFPDTLSGSWVQIYFTDEYEWTRMVEATLLSVTPASPVPIPAAALLFAPAMVLLGGIAARRRSCGSINAVGFD